MRLAIRVLYRDLKKIGVPLCCGLLCQFVPTSADGQTPPPCDPPPMGIVGWWPGDGNANDIVGGNNGTLVGGVTFAPGEVGQAFSFDGLTGAVVVPDAPSLDQTQQLTVDAWVYPTAISGSDDVVGGIVTKDLVGNQYDIGRRNADSCAPSSGIPTGNIAFAMDGITGLPNECRGWVNGGAALPLGAWSHIALTFDGHFVTVYVNGAVTRQIAVSGTLTVSTGPLTIGARSGSDNSGRSRFAGEIDEVDIFNRALSASEIQAIYAAGSAGKCKGCQVKQCGGGVTDNCVSLSSRTGMAASFTPSSGLSLYAAAAACGFMEFDWVQVINQWSSPSGLFAESAPTTAIVVPPALPFFDPAFGGYTYQFQNLAHWLQVQPNFANAYPFYYSPLDVPTGIARTPVVGPSLPITLPPNTLNFFDTPRNHLSANPVMGFTTQLVGVVPCAPPSTFCNSSGFMPSAPLFTWTWMSDFNGSGGGVYDVETASTYPPDPGSGTGGITITNINGVPQTPPNVSCTANPTTLWPPNGKSVLVTVSGTITPGTSPIVSAAYAVTDEYGQVQPSGTITLRAGGSYSFGISLIAARNGNDPNGRTYTIMIGSKDTIGNLGFCSTVVTVPHDQGN
jgi:hypothetical protein